MSDAARSLVELARAIADERGERWPHSLNISVTLDPRESAEQQARGLRRQLARALEGWHSPERPIQPGRAPCFLCASSGCVHAAPPDGHVLAGYRPTGKPEWKAFANACLDAGDPRVDQLFEERAARIALVSTGDELTARLDAYDTLPVRVLGQVAFGLVPARLDFGDPAAGRTALALLVLEAENSHPSSRLALNLLGVTMDDVVDAAEGASGGPAEALRRTIRYARERLRAVEARDREARRRGEASTLSFDVDALCRHVAGEMEHAFRSASRRTRHGQDRHDSGQRPTDRALLDARDASRDRHFGDVARATVIVVGKKQRAHVFNAEARLVTSFDLAPGELERKVERKRWAPLERTHYERFRDALQRALAP